MMEWLRQLEQRERRALYAGAAVVAVALVYFLAWEPYVVSRERTIEAVRTQRESLAWMLHAAEQVKALRQGGASGQRASKGKSVLSQVDRSARSAGLGQFIARMEPQGNERVRIWLKQAPFDKVMTWLRRLREQQGIRVTSLDLEREKEPGYVGGRLALGS